jgi:hypothetical protein
VIHLHSEKSELVDVSDKRSDSGFCNYNICLCSLNN